MKLHPSLLLLAANCFISGDANADHFLAPTNSPTFSHSPELQHYVKTIARYQPETAALKTRLRQTMAYYKKIHISKTITKKQYTVDCIPFAEQPALIDNPSLVEKMLPGVKKATHNNLSALITMGKHFDFNPATQCPLGSVAILRPSKIILTSKIANKKTAPGTSTPSFSSTYIQGGYSYQIGQDNSSSYVSILTDASQAYFKGPQRQYVTSTNFSDHSLDQFWFSNISYEQSGPTYTVEFGIIASVYFTYPAATTSIFVFASIDNYGNNSCYNLECSNFVQLPNTPVLGNPTDTTSDYMFQVTHTTLNQYLNTPAYYLTLVTHNSSGSNATNSSNVLLGYYADSLYPSANDLPQYFSAGAEVYADYPNDGTLMYGNYMTPYVGYTGYLQIVFISENGNSFPYYVSNGPSPYGLIWHLGQTNA